MIELNKIYISLSENSIASIALNERALGNSRISNIDVHIFQAFNRKSFIQNVSAVAKG